MTRKDIIRMAREATSDIKDEFGNWLGSELDKQKFAALVAAHERERIIAANAPEIEKVNEYIKALEERQWVGLTDEEIKSLPSWWPSYEDAPALIQLVKDVEAKLKEKNGG
jgi:hypothetical protein